MRRILACAGVFVLLAITMQAQTTFPWPGYANAKVDVRTYGAKCNGSTDDTTAIANAATGAGTAGADLLIPSTGSACLTSQTVQLPVNINLDVEGTLELTASATAVVEVGTSQSYGSNPTTCCAINKRIYGPGAIDPNGFAQYGIFVRQYLNFLVEGITIGCVPYANCTGNATSAAVLFGDSTISGGLYIEGYALDTLIWPGATTTKVTNSVGIEEYGSDAYVRGNTIMGYDIGVQDVNGGGTWIGNHVWGYVGTNQPTKCFVGADASYWTNDVADTCASYGFYLTGVNDEIVGAKVFSSSSTSGSFTGIEFTQASPFATVSNSTFFGTSADPMTIAIGGTTNTVNLSGNECQTNVTTCNVYPAVYGNVVATAHLTAQAGNVSSTNIYTPTANGTYMVCEELTITQAATNSSTTPYLDIYYYSAVDGQLKEPSANNFGNSTGNGTGITEAGCVPLYVKGGQAISYWTSNYQTNGTTSMQYALNVTIISENSGGN